MFPNISPTMRRSATASADGELFGAYVADRWQMTAATTAELGLRWDRYAYGDRPIERHASPRLGVHHELDSRTALRWSIGRYFQPQRVHELQIEDGITTFQPAQRADQMVFGVERRLGERYLLRAEAYRKSSQRLRPRFENLFDPLAILPELEPDRTRIAPEEAASRGLELSVHRSDPDGLRWWVTFVRARATDVVAGQTVPRSWDQRYAAQLGVDLDTGSWALGAVLGLHTGWPTTGLTLAESAPGELTAVVGQRNALRLGGYASLDLRARRRVPLRVGALDVFVEVSNAANRSNPCCGDFDLEEGDDGAYLEHDTDAWLPRLATFGILWQF
jgi:outer membrane receptor protein involved in Fe transport